SWSTMTLSGMINSVAMPAFSQVRVDAQDLGRSVAAALRIVSFIALPICALTLALAHPLITTIYGDKWIAAAPLLAVLSLYTALFVPCLVFTNVIVSVGRSRVLLGIQALRLVTLVPATIVGGPVN